MFVTRHPRGELTGSSIEALNAFVKSWLARVDSRMPTCKHNKENADARNQRKYTLHPKSRVRSNVPPVV